MDDEDELNRLESLEGREEFMVRIMKGIALFFALMALLGAIFMLLGCTCADYGYYCTGIGAQPNR